MILSANGGEEGLVFNIQRFSIHDGPGIRTTVFLKGCPLNCLWCSNPESKISVPNLMVRDINCRACGACVKTCAKGAITITKEKKRKIDWKKCNQCLSCANSCIYGALNICGRYMKVKEVLDEVMRDIEFYRNSGGGITLSGGEPLMQNEFAVKLLAACKKEGLHTTVDTSGYVPWEKMEKVLRFVDLALYDIKNLDCGVHKKTTGVGNKLILENLLKASKLIKIWIRIPLVANSNDSEEHIRNIAHLGKNIGVERISLLPYHEGGKTKSEQMGRSYDFHSGESPTENYIMHLKENLENAGFNVFIGS